MAEGCAGGPETNTPKVLSTDLPQSLLAATDTIPPEVEVVTNMVSEVELPDHPDGNVQVYELAPATGDII